ncbi:hypothetical protein ACFWPA_19335 [Rhodococcus sp. NPDC058505]|uniref:hypothetical protein n=1 Tax=unclassified Rhodococcus (in: high G+C Gram-positive bacteria) TaxID=192944 RepID=UPI00365F003D
MMKLTRTATLVATVGLALGAGSGIAIAAPAEGGTGSTAIETIERAATQEDANGAVQTAVGEMTVKGLRECGLGALIGKTTDEMSVKNVAVFVGAMGKRVVALVEGPAALVSVAAGGCVERTLLAFDVSSGSAAAGGSVASLALGGFLGTGSLASASSDTGSSAAGLLDSASSDTGSADAASSDTGSLDTGSLGADLEASGAVSDALFAGSAGA